MQQSSQPLQLSTSTQMSKQSTRAPCGRFQQLPLYLFGCLLLFVAGCSLCILDCLPQRLHLSLTLRQVSLEGRRATLGR